MGETESGAEVRGLDRPVTQRSAFSGTGLTRCVRVQVCVDWKPTRKQVEQRLQPASRSSSSGPGPTASPQARLSWGPAAPPSTLPEWEPEEQRAGGQGWPGPGWRWPPASAQGSLASTLRAPDPQRGEPGSLRPTSPRGPGPGQAARSPQGPRCPGRWAFGRQTLHRAPRLLLSPAHHPASAVGTFLRRCSGLPRLQTLPLATAISPPHPTSSAPKVLPQGTAGAGSSRHSLSFPATPNPVLVTPSLGFSCLQAGQHHAA